MSKEAQKDYQAVLAIGREAATLGGIGQILGWDQETHMPPDAAESRAEQAEMMAKLVHQKQTGKGFEKALGKLIDLESGKVTGKGLSLQQKAALREWRDSFLRATKLPLAFVQKTAKLNAQTIEAWRTAREANAFGRFAPFLEKQIDTVQKRAEYLGYEASPYDALVDEYEPGMTKRKVATLFNAMKGDLVEFRKGLVAKGHPKRGFLHKRYAQEKQMKFAEVLAEAAGFTRARGALDLTTHPFCISPHPTDSRITTRIEINDPMTNFLAVLHETGHYLYEVNLPAEHFGSPLCEARSMAVHESQSRWWETLIGQGLPFWTHYFPLLKKAFPTQLKGVSLDTFYKGLNAILDTPIRVTSDEVSYPLHVILRFELESQMVEGQLSVRDLPEAWNSRMEEYLQITPKNDAEGCLQDIHWAWGHFGYFPTYLVGNLYAGQFFEAFGKAQRGWAKKVEKGETAFIRDWLRDEIHVWGRTYSAKDLCKKVTGKSLTADAYLTYLKKKYKAIYP